MIIVEAYAPDGEMMGSQSYSHGALNSADIPIGAEDNTQELEIKKAELALKQQELVLEREQKRAVKIGT